MYAKLGYNNYVIGCRKWLFCILAKIQNHSGFPTMFKTKTNI